MQSDPRHSQTVMGEEYVVGRDKDQGFSWGPQHLLDDHRLWRGGSGEERLWTSKCCLIPGQTDRHDLNSSTSPLMKILNLISLASPLWGTWFYLNWMIGTLVDCTLGECLPSCFMLIKWTKEGKKGLMWVQFRTCLCLGVCAQLCPALWPHGL